jgi:uncharacterized SAM-binding protein YcdF (DUF218 family)
MSRRAQALDPAEVDVLARRIWDYHHIGHSMREADCIVALGSHDVRVAERAAQVFLQGLAPLLVCSGKLGALTLGTWTQPEAEIFAEIAVAKGVPRNRILVEARSTNTGENVGFTRSLLAERGVEIRTVIAVQKPYMERRTYATFRKVWPEIDVCVTSPQIDFVDYPNERIAKDDVIHIMVGDLQRVMVYGERGYQIPQDVPADVRDAYEALIALGYTKRLIEKD